MNHQSRPLSFSFKQLLVLLIALPAISSAFAFGQEIKSGGITAVARPGDAHYYERIFITLREPESDFANPLKLDKLRKDFLQLQISNNFLFDQRRKSDERKTFAASLGEINKRAVSLNRQLPLPELTVKNPNQLESLNFNAALFLLDETILRFAASPAFRNAAVMDVLSGEQARRDLELIIRLSESLRKRAAAESSGR